MKKTFLSLVRTLSPIYSMNRNLLKKKTPTEIQITQTEKERKYMSYSGQFY